MDTWVFNWLFWLAGFFLVYELAAVVMHGRTLSRQTWNWFSLGQRKRYWLARRIVFVVFWISLGIAHFLFQAPALWSVILPGIPFAAVIGLSSFLWKDATTSEGVAAGITVPLKYVVLAAKWLGGFLAALFPLPPKKP